MCDVIFIALTRDIVDGRARTGCRLEVAIVVDLMIGRPVVKVFFRWDLEQLCFFESLKIVNHSIYFFLF